MWCKEWTASDKSGRSSLSFAQEECQHNCQNAFPITSSIANLFLLLWFPRRTDLFDSNKYQWAFLLPNVWTHLTKQRILRKQHSHRACTTHRREKKALLSWFNLLLLSKVDKAEWNRRASFKSPWAKTSRFEISNTSQSECKKNLLFI